MCNWAAELECGDQQSMSYGRKINNKTNHGLTLYMRTVYTIYTDKVKKFMVNKNCLTLMEVSLIVPAIFSDGHFLYEKWVWRFQIS